MFEYISKNQDKNIIINLPFDNYINGEYYEYIPVIVQKVTKDRLFFIKTFKTTYLDIEEEEAKKFVSKSRR